MYGQVDQKTNYGQVPVYLYWKYVSWNNRFLFEKLILVNNAFINIIKSRPSCTSRYNLQLPDQSLRYF